MVVCKRSVRLLRFLADKCSRPSALLWAYPSPSAKVMNKRLRKMIRCGIVKRTVLDEKSPVELE